MDNKRECAYKSGSGCLMKNKTFPLHDCGGVNNCRYEKMGKTPRPEDSSGSSVAAGSVAPFDEDYFCKIAVDFLCKNHNDNSDRMTGPLTYLLHEAYKLGKP